MTHQTLWIAVTVMIGFLSWGSTGMAQIKSGDMVTFDYTLTDGQGVQLDTSKGKEPLTYQHGSGNIIPGLEKQLAGMKPGQKKIVKVAPSEAYGPVNPQAIQEVQKDRLPTKNPKVGDMFMAQSAQGQQIPVRVAEVKDQTVVVDFNHPLAGKTLIFDVKIVSVKPGK